MKLSTMIAATAIATTPVAASASTKPLFLEDGAETNLAVFDKTYQFLSLAGSSFTHTFVINQDGQGMADLSFDSLVSSAFDNLSVTWYAGSDTSGTVLATGSTDVVSAAIAEGAATLYVSPWTSSDAGQVATVASVVISAVPVPAGLLLMGTALAGLGALRRRK